MRTLGKRAHAHTASSYVLPIEPVAADSPDTPTVDGLLLDPYPDCGNSTMLINCHSGGSEGLINCKFVNVTIHGWPHVAVMTTKAVKRGEQLFVFYGPAYWDKAAGDASLDRYMEELPIKKGITLRRMGDEAAADARRGAVNMSRIGFGPTHCPARQ